MHNDDEYLFPPTQYDERDRSHSPPMFAYSTYPPPPEDILLAPYGSSSQSYRPMTTAEVYPDYLATTMPTTLPSMTHFSDALKRDSSFGAPDESSLSPYMNYGGYIPGLDMSAGAPSPYDHSNPHVSSPRPARSSAPPSRGSNQAP